MTATINRVGRWERPVASGAMRAEVNGDALGPSVLLTGKWRPITIALSQTGGDDGRV